MWGSSESRDTEWGIPRSGGIYVTNPRKGIDWKTERNKGHVVYFVKPRASYTIVAEDKKSKLAEMVGGGSA